MVHREKKQGLLAGIVEFFVLLLIVFLIRTFVFGLYQVPTGSMETTMLVGERFFADKFSYLVRDPQRGEIIAFNEPKYNYSSNPLVYFWQQYVWGPSNWTKRVIGLPGDHVRGVVEDGKPVVYVNGKKLDEPYLNKYPLIESADHPLRSYDPSKSFVDQPFYRITNPLFDSYGELRLRHPQTPNDREFGCPAVWQGGSRFYNGTDEFSVKLGPDEYWLMGDNRKGSSDSRCIGPVKRNLIHGRIIFRIWSIDSDWSWWILDLLANPIDFWKRVRWDRFFQWIS